MGRPTKFQDKFIGEAAKLCALGATDIELADFFGVGLATINVWKQTYPKFQESIKTAKAEADNRVERRLYERAMGYEHPEVHITSYEGQVTLTPIRKIYPPEVTAAIFWLKNRRSEAWRDIKAVELANGNGAPFRVLLQTTDDGL